MDSKDRDTNIRYQDDCTIKYKNEVISRSINEIVWYIDTIDKKQRYAREKFGHNANLIDLKARKNIKGLVKIASAHKYYYRVN